MAKYLIDTCILIDLIRGKEEVFEMLSDLRGAVVSFVTYGELLQGVRKKREIKGVEKIVEGYEMDWGEQGVMQKSMEVLKTYYYRDGTEFLDAILAATAMERKLVLVTDNIKHFRNIKGLKVKRLSEVVKT